MTEITAAQRADKHPYMIEWVAAKDAQNAAEAALGAQATAAQKAAAAAAVEAKQITDWKATIIPTPIVTVVQKAVEAVKTVIGGTSGGGFIVPPTAAQGTQQTTAAGSSVTPVMTGSVSPTIAAVVGGIESRRSELQSFAGWDNDANIRSIQQKSWDIYIQTGSWTSPEQVQLHDKAEAARKAINLAYQGALWGTADKAAADKLILPTDQFPTTNGIENGITGLLSGGANGAMGNMLGLALSGGLLLLIFSAFKKH